MKKNKYILIGIWLLCGFAALLTGCSDDMAPEQPDTDTWNVLLTRSTTDGNNVTVALRYDETTSYGTLMPASQEGETATWISERPQWPSDKNTRVEVITFCPQVETLPETVSCTDGKTYKMDYTTGTSDVKPQTFEFTHLMAQLEVHIKISDDEHHHTPTDGNVNLYIKGEVDYPNKKLKPAAETLQAFSLGEFRKDDESNTEENWTNSAQLVIPQTLAAGDPCLTFKTGDKTYTFTPEENIVLKPGKKTKLYLGVAYENDYIVLDGEGVTVTAWDNGEDFGNKEAE